MILSSSYSKILGLNRRNQEYVRPYNSPSAKNIADNKILTKKILAREGIKTPEIYKVIRNKKQLRFLDWDSLPRSFVIKPNKGTGGNGIILFYGKRKDETVWIRPSGEVMGKRDISLHIENILEGRFSMGSKTDSAIIEERVKTDPLLKQYSYKGVPDIRIICFSSVPIMAMTRLPTRRSNGTANLHSGAICTGIDIGTGITTYSMQMRPNSLFSDVYEQVDSTTDLKINKKLSGIQIPDWDEILRIALVCQKASNLGYIGVDIAIDREKGPVVFELNARPGLGIQVANQTGLRWRLEKVRGLEIKSIKHGIRVAKNLFGGEIEESIEAVSGRKVININEKIFLYHSDSKEKKKPKREAFTAFMDTGVLTSRISRNVANRLGFLSTVKFFKSLDIPERFESLDEAQKYIEENNSKLTQDSNILRIARTIEEDGVVIRPVVVVEAKISGEKKDIEMIIMDDITYPVVLGRRDLKGYLIDTSTTFK